MDDRLAGSPGGAKHEQFHVILHFRAGAVQSLQMGAKESADVVECLFGRLEHAEAGGEDMGHALPDMRLDPGRALGIAQRVVAQHFGVADMDEDRWQAAAVGMNRRDSRISAIVIAEIERCGGPERARVEQRVGGVLRHHRRAFKPEIGPGRHRHGGDRCNARILHQRQQRQRKAAAG